MTRTLLLPSALAAIGHPAAMNDAMLAWWRSISPPQARHEVIAAAEAIDSVAARLPESIVAAILAARPRTLIRGYTAGSIWTRSSVSFES